MPADFENTSTPLSPASALNLYNPTLLGRLSNVTSSPSDAVAVKQSRYGFKLGNLGFLIHDTDSEVIELPTVYRIPNSTYWLRGIINLRGNLVPVFDIAWLLKIERAKALKPLLLILDKGESAVGILIDTLPKAISLSDLNILSHSPPLPEVIRKFIHKVYSLDEQVWFEFDHRKFFLSLGERMRS